MVLIDLSQVMLSSLFAQLGFPKNPQESGEINPSLIRHVVFNCLRSYKQKYSNKYGRLVVCADNKSYWRKTTFPYYKANRKKDRDKSGLDWKMILDTLHEIKDDLAEFFPYQVLDVHQAEADDIIAVASKRFHLMEKILILSGDHDFVQLQVYPNIQQFSPIQGKWIISNSASLDKKIHIMQGDKGDGIPNFLSPDDCLVKGERQKSLTTKKLDFWATLEPERFCTTSMLRGYKRNEALIDLDLIPQSVKQGILDNFETPFKEDRSKMYDYFVKHRMKMLMSSIGEF